MKLTFSNSRVLCKSVADGPAIDMGFVTPNCFDDAPTPSEPPMISTHKYPEKKDFF